jgi:hypothetical protein
MPEETIAEELMEEPARRRAPRKGLLQELLMRVEAQEEVIRQLGATFATLSTLQGHGSRRAEELEAPQPAPAGRLPGPQQQPGRLPGLSGPGARVPARVVCFWQYQHASPRNMLKV